MSNEREIEDGASEDANFDREFRRDLKRVRVRYWLNDCLQRTGQPNVHALGCIVEPDLRWMNEDSGERSWPNKWRHYAKGSRTPRAALVDKVEGLRVGGYTGEGSKAVFHHPLWDVLADEGFGSASMNRLLDRLSPATRVAALKAPRAKVPLKRLSIPVPSQRDFHSMERRVGLDPLALSTLISMRAGRAGLAAAAKTARHATKRYLILLFPTLRRFGIAEEMYRFYEEWIWETGEGLGNDITRRVTWMSRLINRLRLLGVAGDSAQEEERALRMALDGRFGFEVGLSLHAPIADPAHWTENSMDFITDYLRLPRKRKAD